MREVFQLFLLAVKFYLFVILFSRLEVASGSFKSFSYILHWYLYWWCHVINFLLTHSQNFFLFKQKMRQILCKEVASHFIVLQLYLLPLQQINFSIHSYTLYIFLVITIWNIIYKSFDLLIFMFQFMYKRILKISLLI